MPRSRKQKSGVSPAINVIASDDSATSNRNWLAMPMPSMTANASRVRIAA